MIRTCSRKVVLATEEGQDEGSGDTMDEEEGKKLTYLDCLGFWKFLLEPTKVVSNGIQWVSIYYKLRRVSSWKRKKVRILSRENYEDLEFGTKSGIRCYDISWQSTILVIWFKIIFRPYFFCFLVYRSANFIIWNWNKIKSYFLGFFIAADMQKKKYQHFSISFITNLTAI